MIHKTSFWLFEWMKMILSGEMPSGFNAGGKIVADELIQTATLPFFMSEETRHEMKADVAAKSSAQVPINSCTADKGKMLPGNA